jgi:hypothetical protein
MRPELIRSLLRQRPFQPFRVYVSNGSTHEVTHPEAANLVVGALLIELPPVGMLDGPRVDRIVIISFIHITKIEVFQTGGATPSL